MGTISSSDTTNGAPVRWAEYFELNNFETFKSGKQYFVIRNRKPEQAADPGERPPRTVVVIGGGRTGTTMTAGVLKLLGEELGDNVDRVLEDRDVSACFHTVFDSFFFWRIVDLRRRFSRLMKERSRRWKRWAFKCPYLTGFVLLLSGSIENPYFIIPTRNLLETSFRFDHSAMTGHSRWRTSLLVTAALQFLYTIFFIFSRRPVMLFSYENVTRGNADIFVDVLADFLSIDIDDAKRQAAIEHIDPNMGYAQANKVHARLGIIGHIDELTDTRIKGWVSDTRQPERSALVEIRTGDRIVASAPANLMRIDVRNAGLHQNGMCGFEIVFDEPLRDVDLKGIHLFMPETGERVIDSP